MEEEKYTISYTVYLTERELWPTEGRKLKEFPNLDMAKAWLASTDLKELAEGKAMWLCSRLLFLDRYPASGHIFLPVEQPFGSGYWNGLLEGAERDIPLSIDAIKNDNLVVDGLSYHLVLEVKSAKGRTICNREFPNIYRLNEHILRTKDRPEYQNVEANIWPTEVLEKYGGITEGCSWYHPLDKYDALSAEEEEKLRENIWEAVDDLERTSHRAPITLGPGPAGGGENYQRKQARRAEYTYICPYCMHELEDCRCESYPWTAVQIDTLLLPAIRALNEKGYRTAYCCIGHYPGEGTNIVFQHDYDLAFPEIPEGFCYANSSFNLFRPCPRRLPQEAYRIFREESAAALEKWAESLPECPCPGGYVYMDPGDMGEAILFDEDDEDEDD